MHSEDSDGWLIHLPMHIARGGNRARCSAGASETRFRSPGTMILRPDCYERDAGLVYTFGT